MKLPTGLVHLPQTELGRPEKICVGGLVADALTPLVNLNTAIVLGRRIVWALTAFWRWLDADEAKLRAVE